MNFQNYCKASKMGIMATRTNSKTQGGNGNIRRGGEGTDKVDDLIRPNTAQQGMEGTGATTK